MTLTTRKRPKDSPDLVTRVGALYARYGWKGTLKRVAFSSQKLARIVAEYGLEPCPKDHVLLVDVAAATNRTLGAIVIAAEAAGVLRRTLAPEAEVSSARSVPKAWAEEYAATAKRNDAVWDKLEAGWYSNNQLATRLGQKDSTLALAQLGRGYLGPYLGDVEHYTATNGHTAWNPWEADAAIARLEADQRKAERMIYARDLADELNRRTDQLEAFAHRRGIHPERLPMPDRPRIGAFYTPADADTLRAEQAKANV